VFVSDDKTTPRDDKTLEPLEVRRSLSSLFPPSLLGVS